jgi:hypothetical protein
VRVGQRFLRRADRLVVQQYLPSEFDWRVITCCTAACWRCCSTASPPTRWRTMERGPDGSRDHPLHRADMRRRAARDRARGAAAIGDSLYGVDLKEIDGGFVVIEVNDNPTIAATEEDRENPEIYADIVRYLVEGEAAFDGRLD